MASNLIEAYNEKRDFTRTSEPQGEVEPGGKHRFIVQKHAATRLHYDLRLELDGVLLSWAVTRGPSLDPAEKRLAVRTEDHPISYAEFEGIIPEGNYGAVTVMLWDRGTWVPDGDPLEGFMISLEVGFAVSSPRFRTLSSTPFCAKRAWIQQKSDTLREIRLRSVTTSVSPS